MNGSPHTPWQATPTSWDLYSRARVVHCQPGTDSSFVIGIELDYPTSDLRPTVPVDLARMLQSGCATSHSPDAAPVWSKNSNERGCLGKSRFHAVRSDGGQHNPSAWPLSFSYEKAGHLLEGLYPFTHGNSGRTCLTARPMDKCSCHENVTQIAENSGKSAASDNK